MNVTGIITEYNPFHLGHLHHLKECKKNTNCNGVICVMSGNFVQRGMPAIMDKWERAKIAVKNGVDLVVELPLIFSISSAETFAYGAVALLEKTKIVNNLYFGSEHGNVLDLNKIASVIIKEPIEYKNTLKKELAKGVPYHYARLTSLKNYFNDINLEEIISSSNNILGIEYLKALIRLNSPIKPYTLKRIGSNYNDENITSLYASATSIRKTLSFNDFDKIKKVLPKESYEEIINLKNTDYKFVYPEDIFPFLKYKILTEGENLSKLSQLKEGLDNKIKKEILNSNNLNEFILNIKSKRYTYTAISRALVSFFIGMENFSLDDIKNSSIEYIRPLAFNERGSKILKEIKNKESVKIITKLPKNIENSMLSLDLLGTKAYSILNKNISPMEDYLRSPIFIK
ncbi:MAG: nucleotidyltransferase [Clostridium sp.]|nr:nucleotidyltransferase [Clostridium sp.]